MDLPYPSIKDCQINARTNSNRKRSIVIKDSLNFIPSGLPLPKQLKQKILKLIQQDSSYELKQLMQQQVINFNTQICLQDKHQNILHVVCRQNAARCLQYITKTQYLYFANDFQEWINRRSKEGLTPIMLCALNNSNQCISILLNIGRIDIHMIDSNKLSAYQMALNNNNQNAIKMLMDYQTGFKKGRSLNVDYLNQDIRYSKPKEGICETIYKCMLDCLLCGGYINDQQEKIKMMKNKKKSPSLIKIGLDNLFTDFIDQVQIGYSAQQLGACEIEWKLLGQYQEKGKTGVLFQNFSPYDMEDINIPMPHFLIVFQSLSQHTSLLRRLIQVQKTKPGFYNAHLYEKNLLKIITTDSYLPFVSKTMQPAFITDKKQGWPMILQKSLAKLFGSYKNLQKLSIKELMQTVTGWPVINLKISEIQNVYNKLKNYFLTQKFMFILQGKANSLLGPKDGSATCFTILNFYQKGDKKMILINCPFVDAQWMQKERYESKVLKMLRGHFNCRGQMTIWIQQQRLQQYFNNVQIAPVRSGFQRQQIQITVEEAIYFKLQVLDADEPTVMYIINNQTGNIIPNVQWQGRNNLNQIVPIMYDQFSKEGFGKFQSKQGQYIFKVKVPKGKYLVIVWSQEQTKIQPIEQDFGHLQLLDCAKKSLMDNWDEKKIYILTQVNNSLLIMIKSSSKKKYATLKGQFQIFEGKRIDQQSIQMINDGEYGYIILTGKLQGEPSFYEQP